MMPTILVIHGPNLNLLGEREPEIYGSMTLEEMNRAITFRARELNISVEFYQSNHEGRIIDFIHEKRHSAHGILINPGAFTHYSYALRDALAAVNLPSVEVHLSDISKRESFRKQSVINDVCVAQYAGKGLDSYLDALQFVVDYIHKKP